MKGKQRIIHPKNQTLIGVCKEIGLYKVLCRDFIIIQFALVPSSARCTAALFDLTSVVESLNKCRRYTGASPQQEEEIRADKMSNNHFFSLDLSKTVFVMK